MFFPCLRFYLLGLLPVHGRLARYVRVACGYYDDKDKIIAWHRAELERLDPYTAAGILVERKFFVARQKAEREGIRPSDARYPRLFDFVEWKK